MPPAVPDGETVMAYLAAHSLENTIEEAVNDAVLNPEILISRGRKVDFSRFIFQIWKEFRTPNEGAPNTDKCKKTSSILVA